MAAVQRMRVRAQQTGRLTSTPQQQVVTVTESDQPIVEIIPVNPEVIYVPVYDPMVHYQQVRDAWTGIRNPDGR